MKKLVKTIKISILVGTITGILPALSCGILFKIFGL